MQYCRLYVKRMHSSHRLAGIEYFAKVKDEIRIARAEGRERFRKLDEQS